MSIVLLWRKRRWRARINNGVKRGKSPENKAVQSENAGGESRWDLIDLSVYKIMGAYWRCNETGARDRRRFLKTWAESGNLWRERAAMVSVLASQRMGSLDETFWMAEHFIDHPHDLMHKASGWMLREAGKVDRAALRAFLAKFHKRLPRTALRYAIERMDAEERWRWMAKDR